jgi:hypothetical protein
MRILALCALCAVAFGADPVPDEKAKEALDRFREAFGPAEGEARLHAVYSLHDVPHALVLKELERLLKHKDPQVRNVAALAVGGQSQDAGKAGDVLLRSFQRDFDTDVVVASVLEGMAELKYMGYWPDLKKAIEDTRSTVVLRALDLLGSNKDWRAVPHLVELYKIALPKGSSWSTGEVSVDTGAAGDADQQAAEAEFNRKYGGRGGRGGGGGGGRSRSSMLRNLSTQLERCVKQITGQEFKTALDFQEWWVENYVMVARKIAEIEGRDQDAAAARARGEQPALRAQLEEDKKKLEEELAKEREKKEKEKK